MDEVERLREEVTILERASIEAQEDVDAHKAEVERLREAIRFHRADVLLAERNMTTHDMTEADETLWAVLGDG
jgi:hypothetical protein